MIKVLLLSLLLISCTGAKTNNGLVATQSTEETRVEAENVEIINNNDKLPEWALYGLGIGIFCFALIIPSPFVFKGFK